MQFYGAGSTLGVRMPTGGQGPEKKQKKLRGAKEAKTSRQVLDTPPCLGKLALAPKLMSTTLDCFLEGLLEPPIEGLGGHWRVITLSAPGDFFGKSWVGPKPALAGARARVIRASYASSAFARLGVGGAALAKEVQQLQRQAPGPRKSSSSPLLGLPQLGADVSTRPL